MKTEKKAALASFGRSLIKHLSRAGGFVLVLAMSVMLCSFSVNAETTYIINDGDRTVVVTSNEKDTYAVLAEAGIVMLEADTVVSTSDSDGGHVQLDIVRAMRVTIKHGDTEETVRTNCRTVGELLASLGIRTTGAVELSCDCFDKLFDGFKITIRDVEYVEETETVVLEEHPMYVYDSSMGKDEKVMILEGSDGSKEITYRVKYVDGLEYRREVISEEIIEKPVDGLYSTGDKSIATLSEIDTESKTLDASNGSEYSYTRQINMIATAYTHSGNLTATGRVARVGIVAADTSVIPFGTLVYITGADGSWTYGYALVGDTGVKDNILDLFMDTYDECIQHGARKALVYVVDRYN